MFIKKENIYRYIRIIDWYISNKDLKYQISFILSKTKMHINK